MRGRQRKRRSTLAGRFVRGWRLDRNPLRRASDRVETLVLLLLMTVFLVAAPLAARATGAWAQAAAQRAELAQQASRVQVTAVVVSAPTAPVVAQGAFVSTANARWTAPDGTVVTAMETVPVRTSVGARVPVWTTRDGQPSSEPLSASQVAALTVLAEVTGVAAVAMVLTLAGAAARWSLNRRRLAGWDADWQSTGPRWTTRA